MQKPVEDPMSKDSPSKDHISKDALSKDVEKIVQSRYGAAAQSGLSSDRDDVRQVAVAFGYSEDELRSIPADANMGLSCGNPIASASLRPGEVVVDLGSGGGLDVFLAAQKVGPTGRAIGIDMTKEMIELARRNAIKAGDGKAPPNVEFHLAMIDDLPLAADSVNCVISNCVINLATDKHAVFREMARVLKPGGRLAISDIALRKPLPPEVGRDILAYVGCVAGAIPIEEYRQGLLDAGFGHVEIIETNADLNVYSSIEGQSVCCTPRAESQSSCCSSPLSSGLPVMSESAPEFHDRLRELLKRYDVNEFAASVKVFAVKPA
jgi:SAM-dependent methyltransferase